MHQEVMQMTRFYIQLSNDEFIRLAQIAVNETRSTRDQARHLLRCALGLDSSQEDINLICQTDFEQKEAV